MWKFHAVIFSVLFIISSKQVCGILVSNTTLASGFGSMLNGYCEHCLYDFCDSHTFECLYGCQPGYVGQKCDRRCIIQECRECIIRPNSVHECTRCQPGYYGPICNETCSQNCIGTSLDTCDRHGNCIYGCMDMYSGDKCDQVPCPYDLCIKCDKKSSLYCHTCEQGYYPNPGTYFQGCKPCSINCNSSCDAHTGACTQCIEPWFGVTCDRRCDIANCARCDLLNGQVICRQCQEGLFPNQNKIECISCSQSNCLRQCNSSTGACPEGCRDGWFGSGQICNHQCTLMNCAKCSFNLNNFIICETCVNGYYEPRSGCIPCPENCLRGMGNICSMAMGHCDKGCRQGFYGEQCQYTCSSSCLDANCSIEGYCQCKPGWYGQRCDRTCPVFCTDCESFKDNVCASCEPGKWGVICENICQENCRKDDYSQFVKCNKDTGACQDGCYPGYHGPQCETPCNRNCFSNICDRNTGNCFGCTLDWYGETCNKKCPDRCRIISTLDRRCNLSTGECIGGCYDGRFGPYCNETCNDRCKNNVCDWQTGKCEYGCKLGYAGDDCEIVCPQKCPNKCSPNCFNDNCDELTKVCVDGCKQGWFGLDCLNLCNKACGRLECDQLTGICINSCNPGWWGDKCDQTCNVHCVDKLCNRNTGDCEQQCVHGYYGFQCDKPCSMKCVNQSCDAGTGACTSCGLGKQGPKCDEACMPGYYGINCELSCGHCKFSSPCYVEDGRCPTGCELGWKGLACQQESAVEDTPSEGLVQSLQIGIGSGVGVLVCFLIIAGFFCWYRHHPRAKHTKTEAPVIFRDGAVNIQPQQVLTVTSDSESSRDSSMNESAMLLGNKQDGSKVRLFNMITKGQFCSVYAGEITQNGRKNKCCVKLVQLKDVPDTKVTLQRLSKEAEMLAVVGPHLNITSLLSTYHNTDMFYIALDSYGEIGLLEYLHGLQSEDLNASIICQLLQFSIDICCGLCHIHKAKVKHRALQAAHVYLTSTPVAKIGDFNWAESFEPESSDGPSMMHHLPDAYQSWLAPESLMDQKFSLKSDIWSLGMLMWEMFTLGQQPYDGLDWEAHKQAVKNGTRPSKPADAHFTLYRAMKSCWRYDGEGRPTAYQLLQQLLDFQGQFASAGSMVVDV